MNNEKVLSKDEYLPLRAGKDNRQTALSEPTVLTIRRSFLVSFSLVIGGICIAILVSWQVSQSLHGFNVSSANSYVLVYGPTLIFIWIVATWRQVDHHIKALAPWKELYRGKSLASKSLLVDYVSPCQLTTFWTAIQNRHFSVVLTTLGFMFLKIATLSSTGLLAFEPSTLQQDLNGTSSTALVSKHFSGANTSTFDRSLLYTTYGVLVKGLEKPFGLGQGLAYATFVLPSDMPPESNFTVRLPAFIPSFQCQEATVVSQLGPSNSSEVHPDILYEILSPECSLLAHSPSFYTLNPKSFRCPERQLSALTQNINCSSSVFGSDGGVYKLLLLADMRYSQELNASQSESEMGDAVQASSWNTTIAQMTALTCRLSYSVQDVQISTSTDKFESSIEVANIEGAIANRLVDFDDADLDGLFRGALTASDSMLGNRLDNGYDLEYPDPMFKTMASAVNGGYFDLLDPSIMAEAASLVSTQLAAQIAHQYLRSEQTERRLFTVRSSARRLQINTTSAWIMIAMLVGLLSISLGLSFLPWSSNGFGTHETLGAVIPLVGNSTSLVADLVYSQRLKEGVLYKKLENIGVYFARRSDASEEILLDMSLAQTSTQTDESTGTWWYPLTIQYPILALTFFLGVSYIVVLEVLQRLSDARTGFVGARLNSPELDTILLSYLPAALVLLLASLFNCLDFNILLLTPYHKMKSGASLELLTARPMLGQVPPLSLWVSLRDKHWAAATSSCAALVGSLMTIVVSGLYTVETFSDARSITAGVKDNLSPAWSGSALNDSGAALISSLIENLKFPDPEGTYNEIVIPKLQALDAVEGDDYSVLTADVPVWRAHLECINLPETNISLVMSSSRIQNSAIINASYGLPLHCPYGGPNGTEPIIRFIHTFNFPMDQNATSVGKLLDLHVGPYDPIRGGAQSELDPTGTKDNPLGCPSLAFIYGSVNMSSASFSSADASTVNIDVCYQQLQRLNAKFNFANREFAIDFLNPPGVNESSVEYMTLVNGSPVFVPDHANATAFQFRPQAHFDQTFAVFSTTNENQSSSFSGPQAALDSFFQGVFYGRTPLSVASLNSTDPLQLAQVRQGIQSFYRRYMAQAISMNMRIEKENVSGLEPSTGDIVVDAPKAATIRRITQDNASKIVLQSMLSFMIIMGVFAVMNIQMDKLLPASANPCTIWGQMSLWAGSSLCRNGGHEAVEALNGPDRPERLELRWWELPDRKEWYGIDLVESK